MATPPNTPPTPSQPPGKSHLTPTTIGGFMAMVTAAAGWAGTEFIEMDRRLTRMESQWDAKTEEMARAMVSIESLITQVDRRLYLMEGQPNNRRCNNSGGYYREQDIEGYDPNKGPK